MQKFYIEFLCSELQNLSVGADAYNRRYVCVIENLRKSAWVAGADDHQLNRGQQILILAWLKHSSQAIFAESVHHWWLVNVLEPKLSRIIGVVDAAMTVYHQNLRPFSENSWQSSVVQMALQDTELFLGIGLQFHSHILKHFFGA